MRVGVIAIFFVVLIGGCARKPQTSVTADRRLVVESYRDAGGASLAFDPPAVQELPRLNLSREPRERWAFVGFEQTTTTFFYLRMDDRQTEDGRNDRLERRAVTERVGTSYR